MSSVDTYLSFNLILYTYLNLSLQNGLELWGFFNQNLYAPLCPMHIIFSTHLILLSKQFQQYYIYSTGCCIAFGMSVVCLSGVSKHTRTRTRTSVCVHARMRVQSGHVYMSKYRTLWPQYDPFMLLSMECFCNFPTEFALINYSVNYLGTFILLFLTLKDCNEGFREFVCK